MRRGLDLAQLRRVFKQRGEELTMRANPTSACEQPAIGDIVRGLKWPHTCPWRAQDFVRADVHSDDAFYAKNRGGGLLPAAASLTRFFIDALPRKMADILEIGAGAHGYVPQSYQPRTVVGLGLVREEMRKNSSLTSTIVCNLNEHPTLPCGSNTFDVVLVHGRVEYWIRCAPAGRTFCVPIPSTADDTHVP